MSVLAIFVLAWENDLDKYQTKAFNKRVKHLNDIGQIWGLLPSSSITCNIYKPLKRISLECIDGAVLPITSTRPSGFVTVDLMDLCDAEGFQSRCFGTRPLLELSPSSAVDRKAEAWGVSWDHTPHKHCDVTLPAPLLELQAPHLFQELRRSDSQATQSSMKYTLICAVCHCCPCSAYWPYCSQAF